MALYQLRLWYVLHTQELAVAIVLSCEAIGGCTLVLLRGCPSNPTSVSRHQYMVLVWRICSNRELYAEAIAVRLVLLRIASSHPKGEEMRFLDATRLSVEADQVT